MVSERVLVVEDEGLVARSIASAIEGFGFEVCGVCGSGERAVQIAGEETPDLRLMDINLKGDMDGVQAASIIKDRYDIPVVFLTAHSGPDTREKIKEAGSFGLLTKPINPPELQNIIGEVVN